MDYRLIYRLKVILEAISSGFRIDTKSFGTCCMETAKLYVELYSWQLMTPTLHKILMHGSLKIEKALLPTGQLSKEAAEARNKHFRLYQTLEMLLSAEPTQLMVDVSDEEEPIIETKESSDDESWLSSSG
ncbi:hypothetical protein ILUMI_15897 [Ignelater luminosus]|uniref:Uncharacterized protein n=1 Tax=Ignelater luminosus TaxID=2038154 RepID=A0A8K0CS74_IGNLU|nr:hypothetical protein ILUMI_15897 [Ignelater luminosus]